MKPSDLSEFFSLLGKAKKEKKEEFDNLLKEADINLDDLASSLVSGIKEAKEDQKKQKKNEEKLIEQLDSIIDVIENPKEVKDITEPAVTIGVPEDFDVTTLEDADDNETVEIIDIIKPEPIKTPEISDTVAQAIKFIEETNIKEEIENSDDTNLDKLKTEIKQVRDILYKVLAHGPGSGEVNLLKLDDVDEDTAKVDGRFLKYDASSGKFVGGSGGAGSQNLDDTLGLGNTSVLGMSVGVITATSFVGDGSQLTNIGSASTANVRTGILDVTGIATFRSDTLIGSGVTLSPDGDVFATGVTTSSSFVGDLTGNVTGTASNATQLNSQAASYYLDYDNFSNTPTIPSNNNQLTNGAGYITTSFTNTNQLTNGAGFIDGSALNASNLSSGTIPDARFPSALPAIDGSALTGVGGTANVRTGILDVAGIATFRSDVFIPEYIKHLGDANTSIGFTGANHFQVNTNGQNRLSVNSGGGVRIRSDANPLGNGVAVASNHHLHLSNPQNDAGETVGIAFGLSTGDDIGAAISHEREGSRSFGNLRFYTKENSDPASMLERMRISKEGNIIVGSGITLSPDGDIFSVGVSTFRNDINIPDDAFVRIGNATGGDFKITHANNKTIARQHGSGNFILDLLGDNKSFVVTRSNLSETVAKFNTNGSVDLFYDNTKRLETTNTGAKVTGDLEITGVLTYEDVTNVDSVGMITARSGVLVGSGITLSPDGDIFAVGVSTFTDDIHIKGDGKQIFVGADDDLEINHNGSNTTIKDHTGGIFLKSQNVHLRGRSDNVDMAQFYRTDGVYLRFNGSNKFATTNTGITVTGTAVATAFEDSNGVGINTANVRTGILDVAGVSTFRDRVNIAGGKDLQLLDNGVIRLGNASNTADLQILHNGNHSSINNGTGNLYINNTSTDGSIRLQPKTGENGLIVRYEGAVQAYHNNTKRFETSDSGAEITGDLETTSDVKVGSGITLSPDGDIFSVGVTTFRDTVRFEGAGGARFINYFNFGRLQFNNNAAAAFGNSSQGRVFSDGTHLKILNNASDVSGNIIIQAHSGEDSIIANQHGSIELYHNDSKKFETAETGAVVTGILTATSNVNVGSGITLSPDGNIFATGITTLGNSSSSRVIIGNPVNLPTLSASTGLVVADMAGNSYYVDMTILGGRTGRSMVKFGDQDSKDVGAISYYHDDDAIVFKTNGTDDKVRITSAGSVTVGSGVTLSPDGDGFFTGVTTSITSSVIGSNTSPLTIGAVSSHHLTVANDNASMILGKSNSDALYLRRNFATGRYVFQTFNGGNDGSIALQPFGGKVGIASAIPTSTLDVNGDVRVGSGITLSPDGDLFTVGFSTIGNGSSGGFEFYHQGVKRVSSTAYGAFIHGAIVVSNDIKVNSYVGRLIAGTSNEFTIKHDNANTLVNNTVGILSITSSNNVAITTNFSVTGVSTLSGTVGFGTHVTLEDFAEIRFGNKESGGNRVGDFVIRHDPTMFGGVYNALIGTNGNVFIENRDTTAHQNILYLKSNQIQLRSYSTNEEFIKCVENQGVTIRYDNTTRLETTNTGAKVTGDLEITGALTYEDVTNVDSIGIITARSDVLVGSGVTLSPDGNVFTTGVTTTSSLVTTGKGSFNTLGVGTTDPQATLHISGADGNSARLIIEDNNNGIAASQINVQNGGRDLKIAAPVDIIFTKVSGGTPLLYLENNQNVGIATDNPSAKLDVFGTTKLRDTVDIDGTATFNGDVNVGGATITNPSGTSLDFSGSITASDVVTAGALLHEGDTDTLVHFSAADTIDFKTFGVERLRVNNSGVSLQNNTTFNTNGGRIILGDSTGGTTDDRIVLGNSDDCFLYHDSTNTFIDNQTGILYLRNTGTNGSQIQLLNNNSGFKIQALAGEQSIVALANSKVELYFDNTKRFETTNTGAKVTGDLEITDDMSLSKSGVAVALFRSTDNDCRVRIRAATDKFSQLEFSDDDDADAGEIRYDHTNDNMIFHVGSNTERLRIDSNGNLTLTGTTGNSSPRFAIQHSNVDTEGEVIRFARTDIPTIRYHSIKAMHGGAAVNNYISFNLHDGGGNPYTSQEQVLRLSGNGVALFGGLTSQVSSVDTSKLAVQGGDNNIGIIQVHAGGGETSGDLAGISFSHGLDDQTARAKGAIAFECDGTGHGRGDLVFYVDGASDNNQVAAADEKLRITNDDLLKFAGNMQFTAANPELEFNNGGPRFRVPAANTLAIHNGGTLGSTDNEIVRISSSGKMGVGTNNPQGQFHVSSGTSGDCELVIEADTDNNNENDNPRIVFKQDGGLDESAVGMNNNELVLANSVSVSGGIVFKTGTTTGYTNATQRFKITSSGNATLTGSLTQNSSDIRLKENIQPITNSLEKVKSLSGFTYNWNKKAQDIGFKGEEYDELQVGLSAQDVEKIQPEVVKPAPVDNNFKTIQYEKLVPLLVEAIKEQQEQIEILKTEISDLKSS